MPQTVVHRYKNERAMQHGVTQMGAAGWRVVGQSSYTPKKGFVRWMLGGFVFFNRRPEHMVTFQADDGVAPVAMPTGGLALAPVTSEERTALTQQWQEVYGAHQAHLGPVAQWLHQKPVAIVGLVVYNLLWLVGLAWQPLFYVAMVLTIALAFVDWTGLRSLGGRVNWALYRREHPTLSLWAIVGLVIFFMVPTIAYLVECLNTATQPALTTTSPVE